MQERDDSYELRRQGWRLDALDEWRKQTDAKLGYLERGVQELVNADKIGAAVAGALEKQGIRTHQMSLTRTQIRIAFAGLTITGLGSVAGILALILQTTGHA